MALTPSNLNFASGINFSGGLSVLYIVALIVGGAVILLLLFVILRNYLSYKVPINIWTRIGTGAVFEQDKGRIIFNKETKRPEALKFRRKKVIEEYPSSDFFHPNDRGRPVLNAVIADNKASFFRVESIMPKEGNIKTKWTQNDLHGTFHAIKRNDEKFAITDWLSKYGVLVGTGALLIVVLIFMIVVFQEMNTLAHAFMTHAPSTANSANAGGGLK